MFICLLLLNSPASSIMTGKSLFYSDLLTICSSLMFVVQSLQVSVLSEPSIQAEADQILSLGNTRETTAQLNPTDHHQHSMAAHLEDNVGGDLVDLGEEEGLQESGIELEYKSTSTDELQSVVPRSEDEIIGVKRYDIDLKAGNYGDSNGFEDELRKGSKQPGSGIPSHFHNSIPTLLQSAHHDDHHQVGHVDGSNADHSCHLTQRSPDHSCGHHRHHMKMNAPVSVISTSVEFAGHCTGGLSSDESMASYRCEDIHQEQSTDSVMILPDMSSKKGRPDDGLMVAGKNDHVESELRKTTKQPRGPSLQHNNFPDSILTTTTSRALNRLDPPVKSGSNHNTFTYSTAGGAKSDQVIHDKRVDSSYLQSLAKISVPPHSGSSSKNHNSVPNLVASE